jgi:hypothetical protein
MDREKLAWAAGFCDGEGCFLIERTNISITISQNDITSLERFKDAVGGLGNVNGPYSATKSRKLHYRYAAASFEHVQAITAMLWLWLGPVKRAQAEGVLRLARERKPLRNADGRLLTCKNGHPRTDEHTKVRMGSDGKPQPYCGTCEAERGKQRYREFSNTLRDELERQSKEFLRED